MKFENPTMNISMFEMESVEVATASTDLTNLDAAKNNAVTDVQAALGNNVEVASQVLTFTF